MLLSYYFFDDSSMYFVKDGTHGYWAGIYEDQTVMHGEYCEYWCIYVGF